VPGQVVVKFNHGVIEVPASFINIKDRGIKEELKKFKAIKIEKVFKNSIPYQTKGLSVRANKIVDIPDLSQIYILDFPSEVDIFKVIDLLNMDSNVIYAVPNHIIRAQSTTPNDSYFSIQWGLTKINMEAAWDATTGDSNLIIADIDTGVDYNHEDLSGKILLGPDYSNDDSDPMDDNGHGTHIAGIIGAITNNSKGVAGIDWNAKILAIKVLNASGNGSIPDVVQGIKYAADNNASVINLSLGDYVNSPDLEDGIDYAVAKGCVIIGAAGNENKSSQLYPAAYSNVLAVAATDQNDKRSVWNASEASNYGSWVDISAPGTRIYSTWLNDTYEYSSGTSMACPIVSGVAALLLSVHPTWTYTDVFNRLKTTALDIDALNPGYENLLGSGRLDAQAALSLPIAELTSPGTSAVVHDTIQISGTANAINFDKYTLKIGQGTAPTSYSTITTSTTKVLSSVLGTYTTTATSDGTYTLKLTAENSDPKTTEATRAIIIDNTSPTAEITSPITSATITDSVTISGTASDLNMYYYNLEYSTDGITFEKINSGTSSVSGGSLGYWNTAGLSGTYTIRLQATDKAEHTSTKSISVTVNNPAVDQKTASTQSYSSPNPFNPSTQNQTYLSYTLLNNFNTSVYLFDITGKLIFKRNFLSGEDGGKAGQNLVPWNGKDNFGSTVGNGIYIYKVVTEGKIITKGKIIILY